MDKSILIIVSTPFIKFYQGLSSRQAFFMIKTYKNQNTFEENTGRYFNNIEHLAKNCKKRRHVLKINS